MIAQSEWRRVDLSRRNAPDVDQLVGAWLAAYSTSLDVAITPGTC